MREPSRSLAGRTDARPWGCIRMKHPEEGALGGPVLGGNPVADPMMAGVSRSSEAAMAPRGAAPATVRSGLGHQAQLDPDRDSDQLIGDKFCPPIFPYISSG